MKSIYFASAFLLMISAFCSGKAPSLSVYQILREHGAGEGELILKVNNPPGRTYYVFGLTMADVPYVVEAEKNGKWAAVLQPRQLFHAKLRPFLPGSYLIFSIPVASEGEDATFRIRIFLYTTPDRKWIYPDSPKHPFVELVSQPFSTKDFRALKPEGAPVAVGFKIPKQ